MAKMYKIVAPLDYVQGHLRHGHLEGTLSLTDEELAEIKNNPNVLKEYDLDTVIDSECIDDRGGVLSAIITEVEDESQLHKREAGEESLLHKSPDGKLIMTWEAFDTLADRLIKQLDTTYAPPTGYTGVYGFPRGGLVLAVKLSHALNLPLLMAPAKGCIVCDDISDTGETLLKYQRSEDYTTATLLMREGTDAIPAHFGERVSDNAWIVFPWEAE